MRRAQPPEFLTRPSEVGQPRPYPAGTAASGDAVVDDRTEPRRPCHHGPACCPGVGVPAPRLRDQRVRPTSEPRGGGHRREARPRHTTSGIPGLAASHRLSAFLRKGADKRAPMILDKGGETTTSGENSALNSGGCFFMPSSGPWERNSPVRGPRPTGLAPRGDRDGPAPRTGAGRRPGSPWASAPARPFRPPRRSPAHRPQARPAARARARTPLTSTEAPHCDP